MTTPSPPPAVSGYPRYFRIAGHRVNSYKVFLCVGIYSGIFLSGAVAQRSGISPLRLGAALLVCAILGMIGARLYHLAVYFPRYRRAGLRAAARSPTEGGGSVFGGLLIVPFSPMFESMLGFPTAVFWDHLAIAIAFGAAWIRFGCVCNGCCVGRESNSWWALRQHDIRGVYKRRIPVQWLEIAWWLLACLGLLLSWPQKLSAGCYAFGVLGWYGLGRFWLESLRETPDLFYGVRVNRVVAAVLALVACAGFIWRTI